MERDQSTFTVTGDRRLSDLMYQYVPRTDEKIPLAQMINITCDTWPVTRDSISKSMLNNKYISVYTMAAQPEMVRYASVFRI